MVIKEYFFFSFLMIIFFYSTSFAGHPLATDDAFSLGQSNFEVEIVSEFYSYDSENEIVFPLSFSFGLFDKTDFSISGSYHYSWDNNISYDSFSDLALELKHIYYDNEFRIGIKPIITLPTGKEENGFGKGKANYGLFLLFTKEWSNLHIHSQFGYIRNNNLINEKNDLWEYSVAVEQFLAEKFSAVFEFGISKNCCHKKPANNQFALVGVIYQLDKTITLDFGLMKGFNLPLPNIGFLLGTTLGF